MILPIMTWFAVHDAAGALQSVGQVVAEQLPAGWVAKQLPGPPGDQMWDVPTLSFVARPAQVVRDRLDDLMADADVTSLTAAQRTKVRDAVLRVFPSTSRLYGA